MTRFGIEPRSPRLLANTLPSRLMRQYMYKTEFVQENETENIAWDI